MGNREKVAKPAANITVWGIVLLVGGQAVAGFPAYTGFLADAPSSSLPGTLGIGGLIALMFIGSVIGLIGFVMLLMGIHRFISRTDPPAVPQFDSEKQNPDGTYKSATIN